MGGSTGLFLNGLSSCSCIALARSTRTQAGQLNKNNTHFDSNTAEINYFWTSDRQGDIFCKLIFDSMLL